MPKLNPSDAPYYQKSLLLDNMKKQEIIELLFSQIDVERERLKEIINDHCKTNPKWSEDRKLFQSAFIAGLIRAVEIINKKFITFSL